MWRPPATEDVLAAHLRVRAGEDAVPRLLGLPAVKEFLDHGHQLREVAAFAQLLGRYNAGGATEQEVAAFSLVSLENQVREWFEEDETTVHLRDKAFLIALAAFDDGPYALTAELGDRLYDFLQQTQNRSLAADIPVFGTHIGKRLQLARARLSEGEEHTEWGPVTQTKAAFHDERASLVLLREVWTGHPSARPALIQWLRRLADDGRPLVRTRAASTVAVLARTDLPSAMALVIEVWARSKRFRHRLVAVNSLTLAHHIGTPNVPRILDTWSAAEDRRLRWVAVRAYALIGPERPAQALAALRAAARELYRHAGDPDDFDVETAGELADAVVLLLLSPPPPRSSTTCAPTSTTTAPCTTWPSAASSAPAAAPRTTSATASRWSSTGTPAPRPTRTGPPTASRTCGARRSTTRTTRRARSRRCARGSWPPTAPPPSNGRSPHCCRGSSPHPRSTSGSVICCAPCPARTETPAGGRRPAARHAAAPLTLRPHRRKTSAPCLPSTVRPSGSSLPTGTPG